MKIPHPFQQEAIDYMSEHSTYLCDDCGLGKTLTAIETVKAMEWQYRKILVICPKSSRTQWELAIIEQVPDAQVIQTNHLPYKFDVLDAWFIVAYDEVTPRSLLYNLAKIVWPVIIMDEAHRIRNHSTKKSKTLINLAGARKIALSATPIEQHGGQLWPVLKWIAPDKFPAYWTWVNSTFEVKPGYHGGFDIGDPKDQVRYQAQVMPHIIRRTKKMVAPELPDKIEIPVCLEMNNDQQSIYNTILESKDALVQLREDKELLITNVLTLFTRLHQVAVYPGLIDERASSCKLDWLEEWMEDHRDLKVIVFSKYRGVVEYLHSYYNCSVVMQGVNESEEFKNTPRQMLAGTIDSMSESLSLEIADAAVFLDEHWSATKMQQAVDRIHRINITHQKLIYNLNCCPIDTRVTKAWRGKVDEKEMLLAWSNSL